MCEPSFISEPEDFCVLPGDTVTLTCLAAGKPKPNVIWKGPDGHILLPTERTDWIELADGHCSFSVSRKFRSLN